MKIKICFTGGGTAGHVYPGLSVLERTGEKCRKKGTEYDFFWIGSSSGMEKQLLSNTDIKYYGVLTGKLRRGKDVENYYQVPFFKEEFPDILSSADLVVARGGAGTIWELSAASKASVIIPLRGSGTRGDQVMNSRFLESIDAATVLSDKIISEDMIYNKIVSLFSNSDILNKYRENIRMITKSDPSDTISDNILETAGGVN